MMNDKAERMDVARFLESWLTYGLDTGPPVQAIREAVTEIDQLREAVTEIYRLRGQAATRSRNEEGGTG